jgi:predicted SnoaL-like aldol condensation-catalyzing enzyme
MKLLVLSLSLCLSLSFLVAQAAMAKGQPGNASTNVKVVQKFYDEVLNRQNLQALPLVVASNYSQAFPASAKRSRTVGSLSSHLKAVYAAMPDLKFTLNDVAGQNNVVFAHWSASATHAGKPMSFQGITMFRLSGGKIADMFVAADPGMFNRQPGKQ